MRTDHVRAELMHQSVKSWGAEIGRSLVNRAPSQTLGPTAAINPQQGFTLVEIAVVILIITLLLGSVLVPLSTQITQRQIADATKQLDEFKESLIGFALLNGYLPCPDKTTGFGANDGFEDVDAGQCVVAEGNLPWVTLGIPNTDPWGNRHRYRVTLLFASRPPEPRFDLTKLGDITVCASAPPCTVAAILTNNAPAIILSHGKNGRGAISAGTGTTNPAPTSANELANTDNDTIFVSRPASDAGSTAGEYDDIVVWLSWSLLAARMVAGGQLP